ncbi:protein mono-ADP-ribosyltransferase PARP3 [Pteropus medius]|uniref:protein mono-ADP-ribosyltransferase PARP3 n=1 Tax=Pteropus vampyrus TaxID=132908 RepID=UPI00196A9A7F|nr:protein mono-ADP-ribosyltransferase PARP3 [Pteropus giganteus]
MASKRKAAVQHEVPVKKKQQEAEEDSLHSAAEALKPAYTEKPAAREDLTGELSHNPKNKPQVYENYDCTLHLTDIEKNNNKFYTIRLLQEGDSFSCQRLWGRVGEVGNSETEEPMSLEDAKKWFEKKFREKTKNAWAERHRFKPHPGKYKLIEAHREAEAPEAAVKVRPCTLDAPTQNLIVNISRKDVFRDAMTLMSLDIKKLPQEMLSQLQITQGFAALEKLEEALRAPTDAGHSLNELSSRFYTIIPHNFGRKKPPPIDSFTLLQAKKDMLLVRAGRWAGRRLPNRQTGQGRRGTDGQEGPERRTAMDRPKDRGEGQADGWGRSELVDRQLSMSHLLPPQRDKLQAHSKLDNWKPLWHGTNVAVVAAILNNGFRITKSLVSKSIYLALETISGMSCEDDHHVSYMFLGEETPDREHHTTVDEPSVKQPDPGFDSVIGRGHTEPHLTQDTELKMDGQRVVVSQAQPMLGPEFRSSTFSQSEYPASQESQYRLCYLLEMRL